MKTFTSAFLLLCLSAAALAQSSPPQATPEEGIAAATPGSTSYNLTLTGACGVSVVLATSACTHFRLPKAVSLTFTPCVRSATFACNFVQASTGAFELCKPYTSAQFTIVYPDAGAQNSPAVTDPTVGQAFLLISFNTASNNITYQLAADNITEIVAAHIHVNAGVGANGSVAIPLYQSPFVALPEATTTGLIAASALTPAVFVGPLEVLPDYNNVDVATVLAQYITPGLAYAQVSHVC